VLCGLHDLSRSVIEPEIGYVKIHGGLSKLTVKGTSEDASSAVLRASGHHIGGIFAHIRSWLFWLVAAVLSAACHQPRQHKAVTIYAKIIDKI